MSDNYTLWVGFNLFVLLMLALDLGVFHKKCHVVSIREAFTWTAVWVSLALLFNLGIWHYYGSQPAVEFLTGYLIEKSLSIDNVFVFALIFGAFAIPEKFQHKVLFWGILSALVLRGIMIAAGVVLIERFSWIIYVFGGFLILTGIKMLFIRKADESSPVNNPVSRLFRRLVPMTDGLREERFWVRENGRLLATPLFLVLILVECADVVFAVDSIPAIFAITRDPFLVYTSNVFAILGLRSLYFALAGIIHRFIYLKTGLALVLSFVGVKMILGHTPYKIDTLVSLAVVAGIITLSVIFSLLHTRRQDNKPVASTTSRVES